MTDARQLPTQNQRSKGASRKTETISREAVLNAALEIADSEGLEALSIRSIASRLGMSPMSAYRFFDSKDDLLDQVAIRIMDLVELPQVFSADWRKRIVEVMSVWRELVHSHPSVFRILAARRVSAGSEGLARLMENVLANLKQGGIEGSAAVTAFWQIFTFTFGHVVFELPRAGSDQATDAAASEALSRIALERGFPLVATHAASLTSINTVLTFEKSLMVLLNGIFLTQAEGDQTQLEEIEV